MTGKRCPTYIQEMVPHTNIAGEAKEIIRLNQCIDNTRRSGRATKGQHRGLDEVEATPPPKKAAGRGKKKQEPEPEEEEADAIIRCICGCTTEDDDDERKMICCESCEAWQHNECMEVSENDDELPEKYYCEQCRPKNHKELLAKVARGERPWEDRIKEREREEEERRAKKGKGKKSKRGRPSTTKKDGIETNGTANHEGDTIMSEAVPEDPPKGIPDALPDSPQVINNKRKLSDEPMPDAGNPNEAVSRANASTVISSLTTL